MREQSERERDGERGMERDREREGTGERQRERERGEEGEIGKNIDYQRESQKGLQEIAMTMLLKGKSTHYSLLDRF